MSYSRLVVEADGASRGNPGAAAGGAVVLDPETGQVVAKAGVLCGHASNNVAEYRGMIEGLDIALAMAPEGSVHVRMDSKLVVEQMSGRWKIKHPDMQDLARTARELIGSRSVTFEWIPREENARADAAANVALDRDETYREL
ncbi:MAG: reverse transcriptase-like protein [Pontimonas sp.]